MKRKHAGAVELAKRRWKGTTKAERKAISKQLHDVRWKEARARKAASE